MSNSFSFVYFQKGQIDKAISEAQETIKLQSYNYRGHKNLAFAYYSDGKLTLALAAAEQAIKLAPKHDASYYILGMCYMKQGEKEKAVAAFKKFLALYQDRAFIRDYKAKAETYLTQLQ